MSTSFYDIYCLNTTLKGDRRIQSVPLNIKYNLAYNYLKSAITFDSFFRTCYQDITTSYRTSFDRTIYEYLTDGVTKIYTLTPSPDSSFVETDVYYIEEGSYVNITDFTRTATEVELDDLLEAGITLYIVTYRIGSFDEDLDEDVMNILAEGMNIPYKSYYQNRTENQQQYERSKGSSNYAQSSFKKAQTDEVEAQKKIVRKLIGKYSSKADPLNKAGWSTKYYE